MNTPSQPLVVIMSALVCVVFSGQLAQAQACGNQQYTSVRTAPLTVICQGFLNQDVKASETKILFANGLDAPVSYVEGVPTQPNNRYFVFFVPPELAAGRYTAIVSGIMSFPGGRKPFQTPPFNFVLDDSASLRAANPMTVSAGAHDVTVQLTATKPVFPIGLIEANFGPGISVGGGSEGGFGPVLVPQAANNAPTSSTADATISISPNVQPGPRAIQVRTGGLALMLAGFVVQAAGSPTISRAMITTTQAPVQPVAALRPGTPFIVELIGENTHFNSNTTKCFISGLIVGEQKVDDAFHLRVGVLVPSNIPAEAAIDPVVVTETPAGAEVARAKNRVLQVVK